MYCNSEQIALSFSTSTLAHFFLSYSINIVQVVAVLLDNFNNIVQVVAVLLDNFNRAVNVEKVKHS